MIIFLVCTAATAAFIALLRRAPKITNGFLQQGIPAIGGLGVGAMLFIAAPLFFLLSAIVSREAQGILLASFFMFVSGIVDDIKSLSVVAKIVLQLVAAGILVFFGIQTRIVYIGSIANIVITLVWVIGITNSFNHLDIIDGLAACVAAACIAAFLFLAVLKADVFIIVLSTILLGGISGFLIFNLPPAKVYFGNTGSHLIGFIISAIAINISYASMENKIALISPLLILGVPIFDTAFLIFMRLSKGRSPFMKSNDHIATRFLRMGMSKWKDLLLMAGWSVFCALSGVFLPYLKFLPGLLLVISVMTVSGIVFLHAAKAVIND